MSKQPTALRLADALEQQAVWERRYGPSSLRDLLTESTAELRRLHAEVERLKTVPMKYRRMAFNAELQARHDADTALLRQALEALVDVTTARCGGDDGMDLSPINRAYEKAGAAIDALRERLGDMTAGTIKAE